MKRWEVVINLKNGEEHVYSIEEMEELQELVENAFNWNDIKNINITYELGE